MAYTIKLKNPNGPVTYGDIQAEIVRVLAKSPFEAPDFSRYTDGSLRLDRVRLKTPRRYERFGRSRGTRSPDWEGWEQFNAFVNDALDKNCVAADVRSQPMMKLWNPTTDKYNAKTLWVRRGLARRSTYEATWVNDRHGGHEVYSAGGPDEFEINPKCAPERPLFGARRRRQ